LVGYIFILSDKEPYCVCVLEREREREYELLNERELTVDRRYKRAVEKKKI
jgi:hypothetical protein